MPPVDLHLHVDLSSGRPHIHPHINQVPALLAKDVVKAGGRVLLDSPVHLITQQVWNKVCMGFFVE